MDKSRNLFDLLQDDEDVEKKTTKTNVAATPAAATTKKVVSTPKPDNKDKSPKVNGQQQRPRKVNNGEQQVALGSEERQSTKRDSKTHPRHQPRTDASGQIRGRQFDRKSGTGRAFHENKKGGAGQGNWGKEGSVDAEANVAATAATTEGEKESTETVVATPAVEDKTITLGEHLKQLQSQSVAQNAPKLRVAGEGESTAQWDDFEPIQREVVKARDSKSVKEEKKTKKNFIQVELKSASSNNGRTQRKTTGGKDNKKDVPKVNDEVAFPTLSK